MYQKQTKSRCTNERSRRKEFVEGKEDHGLDRPILFDTDDVRHTTAESKRCVAQKAAELSRGEFSSYFYGPKRQIDPVYSVTTHTMKGSKQQHGSVIPTYPSLVQNVRWNPAVESAPEYYYDTCDRRTQETSSRCRCRECGGKHCRGRSDVSEFKFRDNIVRFSDNFTMIPKLNDASCGSCTLIKTSSKTSEASVSAFRDNHCAMTVSQVYLNCDPIPILKKKTKQEPLMDYRPATQDNYCTQTEKKCRIADDFQEAVRDTEVEDYPEYAKTRPMRTFPKVIRNRFHEHDDDDNELRKNIYNEGISDLVINNIPQPQPPPYSEKLLYPSHLKTDASKISVVRKSTQKREDYVPYSHYTESKYHNDCKKVRPKPFNASNNSIEHLMMNPRRFKKTYSSRPLPDYSAQSIKFPRRVLTSERNIESFIGNRSVNYSI